MDLTSIDDFLKIFSNLPTKWQITFVVVFFLAPKIIQILGGNKVVGAALGRIALFIEGMMKRYQARRAVLVENQVLTEAYTRTLVVESLGMFSARLERIDHKINHVLLLLEPEADIERVEIKSPRRTFSETIQHPTIHKKLQELREENEKNGKRSWWKD